MKRFFLAGGMALLIGATLATAQEQGPGTPTGQRTLAATMSVYVFPTTGQDAKRQSMDEAECYKWAVQNTQTDPFQLQKKAEKQRQQAEKAKEQAQNVGKGEGAAGAVKGAAAGALIGEIVSDDAGEGAAWGAAAGIMSGRRRARAARRQAENEAEEQAVRTERATGEELENFKKAFSVCLEAKDYLVKY